MKTHIKNIILSVLTLTFVLSTGLHYTKSITPGDESTLFNFSSAVGSSKFRTLDSNHAMLHKSMPWQHNGITFDRPSQQGTDTTINITTHTSGDTSGLQYKFVFKRGDDWSDWGVIKQLDSKNYTSWTPTAPGNYTIYADIQDQYGNFVTKTAEYKIDLSWQHNGITFDRPSQQGTGTTINITTHTSGDTSGLQYKFVFKRNNDWSNWGVIKQLDSKNYTSWTPTIPGNYTIYADIQDQYGNIVTKTAEYKIDLSWQHNGITFDRSSPQILNNTINITTRTSGDTSKLQYKFVFKNGDDWSNWGVIKQLDSKNYTSWTPTTPGNYTIYADIQDQYGNIVTKTAEYKIDLPWQHNGITFDKSSPQILNTTINITTNTSGDTSGLKYKFVFKRGDDWSDWGVIKQFDSKNYTSWTPTSSGNYTIYADVQDQSGNIVTRTSTYEIRMVPLKGIDVSQWQGDIDWNKVKNSGINFAMIRSGYGKDSLRQTDKKFYQNVRGAKAAGMPIGVYHYSYAMSVSDAIDEANLCLQIIRGYQYEYPIVFDFEDPTQRKLGKRLATDIVKAFCNTLENAGYYAAVYTNCDFLENYLYKDEIVNRYALWLAHWQVANPRYTCSMWQYTDKGRVNGINGDVDLDWAYVDYPSIMKSYRINGF